MLEPEVINQTDRTNVNVDLSKKLKNVGVKS